MPRVTSAWGTAIVGVTGTFAVVSLECADQASACVRSYYLSIPS